MTSTRHAIVALTLPFGLGAAIFANVQRPAIAVVAAVLLAAYVLFELWLWGHAQRVANRRRWDAQKQAGYPLWSVTGEQDRLWVELERRRVG